MHARTHAHTHTVPDGVRGREGMMVMARNINVTALPATQNLSGQGVEWNSNAVNQVSSQVFVDGYS